MLLWFLVLVFAKAGFMEHPLGSVPGNARLVGMDALIVVPVPYVLLALTLMLKVQQVSAYAR